ncbi:LysR family transcriptional regulator [Aquitalea sp.]|uniref:LysR family transcriptional regulator n=1 Tax=Aquitalea sp. TaxID=1872623 RepID=UPI00258D90F8|nr:LysR family transcriptional regulator [Aquitalea sp.]
MAKTTGITQANMTAGRRFLNDRLDWNLLRTYLVIAQESSISRAAARLHVTQSAVSQALKRLEEQLQCTLILRQGTRFALTETGDEIFRIASDIYSNVSRLSAALENRSENMQGKVRILCATGLEVDSYDTYLARFHQQFPRVELEVEVMRSADIISGLLQKTATLGLGLCRLPQARLERRCLITQRYAFYCGRSHPLFGQGDLTLESLQGQHFVSFSSDQLGGNLSPLAIFRDQQGYTGKIIATASSLEEVRRLVRAGYGIGSLPEHVAARDVEQGELWRLPPANGIADLDIYLLWNREQKLGSAESVFLEGLQHQLLTPAEGRSV